MGDAEVEFLLQKLRQLLTGSHISLISGAEEHLKKLEKDLSLFNAIHKEYSSKNQKDTRLQELLRLMRGLVHEADDIIDAFVTQKLDKSIGENYFSESFTEPVGPDSIAEVVDAISSNIIDIFDRIDHLADLTVRDDRDPYIEIDQKQTPMIRKVNVVGFEDEAEKLIGYLKEETAELDVITIIGKPGSGKATVAWMIFDNPEIQFEFPIRIWVHVSPKFTMKDVFLTIMKGLKTNLTDEIYCSRSDQELAKLVAAELEPRTFLIVMDGLWNPKDWDKLKVALPNKGKILITSTYIEVGNHANHNRNPHQLRILNLRESCLLLSLEALGRRKFPPELNDLGENIAGSCHGLPGNIVMIGGVLARTYSPSAGISAMVEEWKKVSNNMSKYVDDDEFGNVMKVISISYSRLPHHLRACFLYVGIFPEDYEIPVWKLINLWIAEGFIHQDDNISMEETAENYLEVLNNRNLVRISKTGLDGRVKTCRIHDIIRDFCLIEARKENFLQEIKTRHGDFEPPVSSIQPRRLCVHSDIWDFISSNPYGPRVRSLVCFPEEQIQLNSANISDILAAFKLLRVLDVERIKISELANDLFKLFHLRYIHLFLDLDNLPSAFSSLRNIQTLIVNTTSRTLEIKADIWEMIHLRHFKTKASATLPTPGKNSKGGEKLQSLGTISPESCTEEVFDRAHNLKKLGVRGKLASLLDGEIGSSFDSFRKLGNLEKLKLLNDTFSDGQLSGLPPAYKFPPNLKWLTISGTRLGWRHMSILGLLEKLKMLELKDGAFMGERWEAADGGFRSLEVLYIGSTNLVFWTASGCNFPSLRHLELHECYKLQEVPIGLADIASLQQLRLYLPTRSAAASAKKIKDAKQEKAQQDPEQTAQGTSVFKLFISLDDE